MVRRSLSDWYRRPQAERGPKTLRAEEKEDSDSSSEARGSAQAPTSPTKRCRRNANGPSFFIGDDDSDGSPVVRKQLSPMASLAEGEETPSGTFGTPAGGGTVDASTMAALRILCADYFENNVSPLLRYVQRTQDQLIAQLKDLAAKVDMKADASDVPTLSQWSTKADVKDVPTLEQVEKVAASLEQKADASDMRALLQADLETRMQEAEHKVSVLKQELLELRAMDDIDASANKMQQGDAEEVATASEIKKVQVVVAAAGSRVDKQLREIRQQMQLLRGECLGGDIAQRWPGRKLTSMSDNDSDTVSVGGSASLSGSFPGSASALEFEDKAQLRKMQTVFAAAGATFNRDLRELRQQVREMRSELSGVKEHMGVRRKFGLSRAP